MRAPRQVAGKACLYGLGTMSPHGAGLQLHLPGSRDEAMGEVGDSSENHQRWTRRVVDMAAHARTSSGVVSVAFGIALERCVRWRARKELDNR